MSSKKTVNIFGVTGSVGTSAADVILQNHEKYNVQTLTAGNNAEKLAECAIKLDAKRAVIANPEHLPHLKDALKNTSISAEAGTDALEQSASEQTDIMIAAIVGFAGLRTVLTALEAGTTVALANKEPLVAAGPLVIETAKRSGARILPLDSEHNAIFQVLEEKNRNEIEKLILTASGGPFLNWTREQMAKATPEQAIAHPNWNMGKKISVDSATMMNKALEIIEAYYLFDLPPEKIKVVIHPQSLIHSMVEYVDGSVLSQMGTSDMRIPVAHVLSWPKRQKLNIPKLNFDEQKTLEFYPPDFEKFPALRYAYECIEKGQNACIAFNAANEIAVKAFLDENIGFNQIIEIIEYVIGMDDITSGYQQPKTVEDIEKLDKTVRDLTIRHIESLSGAATNRLVNSK